MTILDDQIKDLTADNILLRGIVAYLLSEILPNREDRKAAAEKVIARLRPEIQTHIKKYQNMNPQIGLKELQRIQRRCGELLLLADNF